MSENRVSRPLLLFAWWGLLYWTYSSSWPRPFDDWKNTLFYIGSGLFCLFALWRHREPFRITLTPSLVCFLVYLFACILSIDRPVYEGWLALARLLLWAACVWVLSQIERRHILVLMRGMVLSAASISLVSWLRFKGLPIWNLIDYEFPFMAPIGQVTYFGDFAGLHVPLALYLILTTKERLSQALWGFCLTLIILGLWMSGTRASVVGVLASLAFGAGLLFFRRILDTKKAALGTAGIVFILAIAQLAQPSGIRKVPTLQRLLEALQHPMREGHLRLGGFRDTLQMIGERPFRGWGLGSFRFAYPPFAGPEVKDSFPLNSTWFYHPHNEILHQWVEVGVAGWISFLLFWFFLYRSGWRAIIQKADPPSEGQDRRLITCALMGLTVSLVSWQFNPNFLFPLSRLLVAFYVALLWKEVFSKRPPLLKVSIPVGRQPLMLIVLVTTLFLGAYQASLYGIVRSKRARSVEEKFLWTSRAYQLARGAFDPLLNYVAVYGSYQGYHRVLSASDSLYTQYPYVPVVLYRTALTRREQGRLGEATILLEHALRNAPNLSEAKELLELIRMPMRDRH